MKTEEAKKKICFMSFNNPDDAINCLPESCMAWEFKLKISAQSLEDKDLTQGTCLALEKLR